MTEVSKKWNSNDALAGVKGEVSAMMQGGFRLVGAAALLYISNVYWTAPAVQAKETTETIHNLLGSLNYGKSSKYALATAAFTLARNMTKKYGHPSAAERNIVWGMFQDAATFSDAVDVMVAAIKTDYNVLTMADLYAALAGNKVTKDKEKPTLEASVLKAIEKAEGVTAHEIGALGGKVATLLPGSAMAALPTVVEALTMDELNALAAMVMGRIAALTPAVEVEEREAA